MPPRSLHVMVVEDDPVFQGMFVPVFAQMDDDWNIHPFENGAGALAALAGAGNHFDLALIDIGLPDMTGIDVIAAARDHSAELPIMVMTAFTAEETFLSAIRAGAHGYLLKSDVDLSLARSIHHVMQGEYPVSPALARHLFHLAESSVSSPMPNRIHLSPRELELLKNIAKGHSYATCAEVMKISLSTVQTHIRGLYRKLKVHNQRQAVSKAQSSGILRK